MTKAQFLALHARMMQHAFLSGIVAARNTPGYEEISGPKLWTEYEPHPFDLAKFDAFAATLSEGQ